MILQIIKTILFVITTSIVLLFIPNKSNFNSLIIIPIIVGLLTKYSLGDWDKGFIWSSNDIVYWITLFGTSYLTILLIKNRNEL
jgi:hypothetical protein